MTVSMWMMIGSLVLVIYLFLRQTLRCVVLSTPQEVS